MPEQKYTYITTQPYRNSPSVDNSIALLAYPSPDATKTKEQILAMVKDHNKKHGTPELIARNMGTPIKLVKFFRSMKQAKLFDPKSEMKQEVSEIRRMQQLAGLIKESQLDEAQTPAYIEEFLNDMINTSIEDADEGENVNGVWEVEEYGNEEAYGEEANTFKDTYEYIKSKGGKITIPGEPDVTYDALNDGSIGYSLIVTY